MNADAFTDILRRELDGMRGLAALMTEDFAALGSGDHDAIESVTTRKTKLIDHLQRLAEERAAAMRAAGIATTREAMEGWLKASGDGIKVWQELLERTREVQGHHQTHQALLEGLARHNQQAIDLLIRLANPEQTYQADGSTTGGFGARSRGTA